ncbi:MAG: hypothetical protein AAFO75_13395 [Pseudomonadota bacterium]
MPVSKNDDVDEPGENAITHDDRLTYLLDMTLELQQMASRSGYHDVAVMLLEAYDRAQRLHRSNSAETDETLAS